MICLRQRTPSEPAPRRATRHSAGRRRCPAGRPQTRIAPHRPRISPGAIWTASAARRQGATAGRGEEVHAHLCARSAAGTATSRQYSAARSAPGTAATRQCSAARSAPGTAASRQCSAACSAAGTVASRQCSVAKRRGNRETRPVTLHDEAGIS